MIHYFKELLATLKSIDKHLEDLDQRSGELINYDGPKKAYIRTKDHREGSI